MGNFSELEAELSHFARSSKTIKILNIRERKFTHEKTQAFYFDNISYRYGMFRIVSGR